MIRASGNGYRGLENVDISYWSATLSRSGTRSRDLVVVFWPLGVSRTWTAGVKPK